MRLVPSEQTRARMRVKDKTCVGIVWIRLMTLAFAGCAIAAFSYTGVRHRTLDPNTGSATIYFWALGPLALSFAWCFVNVLLALIVRRPLHPATSLLTDFIAFGTILTFGILVHFKISNRPEEGNCEDQSCDLGSRRLFVVERVAEIISLSTAAFEFIIFVLSAIACFTQRYEGASDRRVQWKGASRGPTGRQISSNSTFRSGPGRLSQASTIQNNNSMIERKGEPSTVDIAAGFERDDPWMASYGNDPAVLDYEKYDNIDLEDHEIDEKTNTKRPGSGSKLGKSKPSPIFISPTRASNKTATRGTALDNQ